MLSQADSSTEWTLQDGQLLAHSVFADLKVLID